MSNEGREREDGGPTVRGIPFWPPERLSSGDADTTTRSLAPPLSRGKSEVETSDQDFGAQPRVAVPSPAARIGKEIGRYVVLGTLGQGGMGTIFEAFDRSLDRRVALKLLRHEFASDHLSRLVREAKALARLSHPNVVQVYEVDELEGETFIAMELVRGQTLRKWSRRTPRPDWRACVELLCQAGLGLAAAHEQGLVHRDFKPGNVIVDDHGRVRVLDFGLVQFSTSQSSSDLSGTSKAARSDASMSARFGSQDQLTEAGTVMGTPAYMSPEQLRGDEVDQRSDQFSFCVSLFEVIHGKRPFGRRRLSDRSCDEASVTVAADAITVPVPGELHALILRGLSFDPEDRWPSMEVLVQRLERLVDVRRRRGRMLAVGAASVVGLGLLGAGLAYRTEIARRCTAAPALIAEEWSDTQRRDIQTAIIKTHLPYSSLTWTLVEEQLDAYAQAWVRAHTQACEATRITQQQSEDALELRMSCLNERKVALRTAVRQLGQADARVVENAVEMTLALPSFERCDDVEQLRQRRQRVPPPEDPAVATEVEQLRERLVEVHTWLATGKHGLALEPVAQIVERAEALGYEPLRGEARFYRGRVREVQGEYAEAEGDLLEAYQIALRHGHDELARRASRVLAYVIGDYQARYSDGLLWGQTALPLAEQGDDVSHLALTISDTAILHMRQGRYDEAEAMHRRALELREGVLEPGHPGIALHLDNLARVFLAQGRFEEAEQGHRRALGIRERALGAGHPQVCESLGNLSNVMMALERYEEAEGFNRRALALANKIWGPRSPTTAVYMSNLGSVLSTQDRHEEAEAYLREALEIRRQALGAEHPDVAESNLNLGALLFSQGRVEEASRRFRRAAALYEQSLGPDHPMVGLVVYNLGQALMQQGQPDEALTYFERALAMQERAHGDTHPDIAFPLVGIISVELSRDELAGAVSHAERVISLLESNPGHPSLLIDARFYLAQALWPDEDQRQRAREQAKQAALDAADAEQKARIEQWLAEHPG